MALYPGELNRFPHGGGPQSQAYHRREARRHLIGLGCTDEVLRFLGLQGRSGSPHRGVPRDVWSLTSTQARQLFNGRQEEIIEYLLRRGWRIGNMLEDDQIKELIEPYFRHRTQRQAARGLRGRMGDMGDEGGWPRQAVVPRRGHHLRPHGLDDEDISDFDFDLDLTPDNGDALNGPGRRGHRHHNHRARDEGLYQRPGLNRHAFLGDFDDDGYHAD